MALTELTPAPITRADPRAEQAGIALERTETASWW
jgi:hypothetical protein